MESGEGHIYAGCYSYVIIIISQREILPTSAAEPKHLYQHLQI